MEFQEENENNQDFSIDNGETLSNLNLPDRSKLCFVCDTDKIDYFFICGNGVCNECLVQHMKSQIEKYKIKVLSEKINFICPGSCRCSVKNEQMESLMDFETKTLYHDVIFKMYISKANDIFSCPKSDCSGAGFVINSKNFLKVNECMECPLCKFKWKNETSENFEIFSFTYIKHIFTISNMRTSIKKYLTTKYCNKCSAPIEKIDGCKHMECNRCENSFCWKCMENWSTHSELACMGMYTNIYDETLRPDFISPSLCLLFVILVLKILFSFLIIFYFLLIIIKVIIFIGLIVIDCFLAHGVILSLIRFHKKNKAIIILGIGLSFEYILYTYKLHPFSTRFYYFNVIFILPIYILVMFLKKRFD
jgi:hypothetical protein